MKDKIIFITGATAGIGLAAARSLAGTGAMVVLHGRSLERCQAAAAQIKQETGNPQVDFLIADLSVQSQIQGLANEFLSRYRRLDVLINNAGSFFLTRQSSPDGIEMTFALNHLSYFLLTSLLLERLKACAPARVVNVASNSHCRKRLNFNNLQMQGFYNGFNAYGRSKLANVLFTYELARRLEGTQVTANALHPGLVKTQIGRNNGLLAYGFTIWAKSHGISPQEGARTVVYLASSPDVEGISGKYFFKEKSIPSDPASYDRTTAERLWQVSSAMTGSARTPLL